MEFPDFAKAGWTTWLESRDSDDMFSKLSIVQTREDCTSILLSSGCPAKVAASLYGLSQEKAGYTQTSGVVQHAENLSGLLTAMQVRMSLLLQERVAQKENHREEADDKKQLSDRPTTDTPNSESSGGSDWSSCSSDARHQEELSSGSTSEWGVPGSPSSSDTASSCSETFLSSVEELEMSGAQSPTGSPPSAKRAKHSQHVSFEQSS